MKILIGDIGNTLTKICLVNIQTYKIIKTIYLLSSKIPSRNYLNKKLRNKINKKELYNSILFASVVPGCFKILRSFLKKNFKLKVYEIKELKIDKIIKISIKNKKQVGSDRLANAVAAYKKFKSNDRGS